MKHRAHVIGSRSEKRITFEASFPTEAFLAPSALVSTEILVRVQVYQLSHIIQCVRFWQILQSQNAVYHWAENGWTKNSVFAKQMHFLEM